MIKSWPVLFILLCLQTHVQAVEQYTTFYHGQYTDDAFGDIISGKTISYEDSRINVLAHAVKLFADDETLPPKRHQWELEGQIAKHDGEQNHWELNAAIIVRWLDFPWNQYVKTTAAIGDGLSYATVVPPIEEASHTNTGAAKLLNYFVVEVSLAPPSAKHWSLVGRIHHRSGIYGLINDVKGGSNVICLGLKYAY